MYNDIDDIVEETTNETAAESVAEETQGYESAPAEPVSEPEAPTYQVRESASAGSWYAEPAKTKKSKGTAGKVIALCLVCALLGGAMGLGGGVLASRRLLSQPAAVETVAAETAEAVPDAAPEVTSTVLEARRDTPVLQVAEVETGKEMTAAEVYAANVNSTVGITTSITTNYWGYQTTSAASGSGFILTDDGYILTNYHVVEDSNAIKVSLYDGSSYDAALIGYDESNDIAVLKIEAEGLTPVVLGDSSALRVGDDVVAIGNPLGELTFSLTKGSVSALDREITLSSSVTMNLIQTDTAINSGNSGGALFNMYGEVVGITNAKYSGSGSSSEASIDNIGFAIPINSVRGIVQSIIEKGYIAKPYIGVTVGDVSEETQAYGLPQGAAIRSVVEDSPAEKAGLQVNDIVVKAGDTEITGSSDLVAVVKAMEPGDELVLTVYRQSAGGEITLTVTVGEQIQSALPETQTETQTQTTDPYQYWGGQGGNTFPWGYGYGYGYGN